jgi:hypothetical protein
MKILIKTIKKEIIFHYETVTKIRNGHTKRDGTIKQNSTDSPMFSRNAMKNE